MEDKAVFNSYAYVSQEEAHVHISRGCIRRVIKDTAQSLYVCACSFSHAVHQKHEK